MDDINMIHDHYKLSLMERIRKNTALKATNTIDEATEVGGHPNCWIWNMSMSFSKGNGSPYGRIKITNNGQRFTMRTHRLSIWLWKNINISGKMVCHKCDVTSCCNPDHLFVGDAYKNMRDMVLKNRNVISAPFKKGNQVSAKPVTINGIHFNSRRDAAMCLGVSDSIISRRIKNGAKGYLV